jgi:hypothetical protein
MLSPWRQRLEEDGNDLIYENTAFIKFNYLLWNIRASATVLNFNYLLQGSMS